MTDQDRVDACLQAGDLAGAAALLEAQEAYDDARAIYEKLWDFTAAARVAKRAGDLPQALSNILRAKDPAALDGVVADILAQTDETVIERCAAICQERNVLPIAARLFEHLGQDRQAADLFERAQMNLEAASLRERTGQISEAIALYEAHLGDVDEGPQAAIAELRLGRILLRYGRPKDAVPRLQAALRHDEDIALDAGRAAAVALYRAGFPHAAKTSISLLQESHDAMPDLDVCLADPALTPIEHDEADHTILAGRYRLGELLGSGGMGRVYEAQDLIRHERVAIKIFTAPGGVRGRDAYKRFVREALTTGRLAHPHIVALRDFNEEMGFIVLEFMSGGTLADRLRSRLDVATCRNILLQLLEGLAAAHQRGIVHRDIKPSNVFFTTIGAAKLGDFGVAHLSDSGETQTGAFIGTLAYMSPEQIRGEPISFATDIYALGVMLYRMLTGRLPFEPPDIVNQHLNSDAPRPSAHIANLPAICDDVVLRCLAKRPDARYDSLAALRADISRFPVTRREAIPTQPAPQEKNDLSEQPERDARYAIEALRFADEALEIHEARDEELGRSVLLAHIRPGELREELISLMRGAASIGAHLSRLFDLSPNDNDAVLEVPLTEHAKLPATDPLDLAEKLASALAPLHAQNIAHGALTPAALAQRDAYYELSLPAALIDRVTRRQSGKRPPTIEEDLRALGALTGLSLPDTGGAGELLVWIRQRREARDEKAAHQALTEALRHAPPGVDGQLDHGGVPK
ncbi:MAG: serine/threonine protein kinase [Deltaproteobacteria bacterium]|nr:serine/threonine protein kinase [Deltaproteobacteria bacterium]